MRTKTKVKYIHEGRYVAELDINVIELEDGWSTTMSLDDSCKMDEVRDALRSGDLAAAAKYARVYEMKPVEVLERENELAQRKQEPAKSKKSSDYEDSIRDLLGEEDRPAQ